MTGTRYETLALDHLVQAGLRLLARNPRCRAGEIDLVMRDGAVIVFVEVRARASSRFGGAGASITQAKRSRLIRAASFLLPGMARLMARDQHAHVDPRQAARPFDRPSHPQRYAMPPARFDVVTFERDAIEWFTHAFALD